MVNRDIMENHFFKDKYCFKNYVFVSSYKFKMLYKCFDFLEFSNIAKKHALFKICFNDLFHYGCNHFESG